MPGNLVQSVPNLVMPASLSTAFTELLEFAQHWQAVAYQLTALLRGLCILNGLAGESIVETGAATGGSSASGIEGAQIVVVGGSTEGDGSIESDSCLWTAPTGEADGVSPEMDCDTQCIFSAEGNTMPDTPGSAVAVATSALLHLIAALRGSSLASAQVHSPVVGPEAARATALPNT